MRHFSMLLLMLTGCGNNLVGSWEGTCEFSAYDMDLELDIEEDDGGDLKGEGKVTFVYYGYTYELDAEIDGTRKGKDVELDLDFGENGDMEVLGELTDSDTIVGECNSGGVDSDVELER